MKILLVSDVESSYIWDHFNPDKFNDIDLILSCGDLKAEYLSFLVTLIKAPLFYIHGNHDTNYKDNPPEGCECIDDRIIKYNGIRIAGFGGCKGYSSKLKYTDDEMKRRVMKLIPKIIWNKGIDILLTHAAGFKIGDDTDLCHEGFKIFNELIDTYSPKYFIHGHVHLNYGKIPRIITYKKTTVINAFSYYILEY